mmetsp:Transcript_36726/g.79540  ORF Transcript_36726/g.79540 Transcript_36726/m.79540 type:complete len:289 (+) Transcript_36726:634-1500(+)
MSTDHRDTDVVGVLASDATNELVGADDIQSGDADNLHRVQTLLLVELGHGGNHGVDRVHDHAQDGLGAELGASFDDALGDVRVGLEKIIASHAWLSGHAGWHQDQIAASQALLQEVNGLFAHLHYVAFHGSLALEVGEVGGHAGRRHHRNIEIEDAQLLDVGVHAHEQRQRLADAAGSATNADLEIAGGLGLLLGLGLSLSLGFRLSLCLGLGLRLGLSLGLGLRLLLLALLRLLGGSASLPVGLDGLLLVLALVVGSELIVGVRLAVLGVDSLLGSHGDERRCWSLR